MKDKEQSSKGSVDNLKTLKNRKERKGKGDHGTCRLSSSPKKAGHGGEHGYKGGRHVGVVARARVVWSKALTRFQFN
jgi:hypothetical protein